MRKYDEILSKFYEKFDEILETLDKVYENFVKNVGWVDF